MKKQRIITRPTRNSDIHYDDFDDEVDTWHQRQDITQARMQRALRHAIKGGSHQMS